MDSKARRRESVAQRRGIEFSRGDRLVFLEERRRYDAVGRRWSAGPGVRANRRDTLGQSFQFKAEPGQHLRRSISFFWKFICIAMHGATAADAICIR